MDKKKIKNPDGFEIGGIRVARGKSKRTDITISHLYDQTEMQIPIEVIRGKEDGPILLLIGAMHGDEINGCEAIKRILSHKKLLSTLKGTIVAAPIVNVFGYNRNVRYLPDRRDLNRCFPGDPLGSLGAQIAHKFLHEVVMECTHVIDFHTGAIHRTNYPQIRAQLSSPEVHKLAMAFDMPVVLDASLRDGSLRKYLYSKDIPMIVFEGGEALRCEEDVVKAAMRGTFSVMESLGMLKSSLLKLKKRKNPPFIACSSHWLRAPAAGSLRMNKLLGNHVNKGDLVGVISDPFGGNKSYVRAQHDGMIIGMLKLPLVNNGDAIVHIATFDNLLEVQKEIELLDNDIDIYNF